MKSTEHEITLSDMLSIAAYRWKIIILPAVIGSLLAALVLYSQSRIYESYALLKIGNRGGVPFETVASLNVVMDSPPMMSALQGQIPRNVASANSIMIQYSEVAGLLRISAQDKDPEVAAAYVRSATDLVFDRHQKLYADHLKEIGSLIQFVKSVIKPIPLSSSMNDFRVEPTRIEVKAVIPQIPLPSGAAKKIAGVFIILCIPGLLTAFYLEGRKGSGR